MTTKSFYKIAACITLAAIALSACDNGTSKKELELKEKEIELRAQELALKKTEATPTPAPVAQAPVAAAPVAPAPVAAAAAVAPAQVAGGVRLGYIYAPPSNVRTNVGGPVACQLVRQGNINIYGFAGSTYDNGRQVRWYYTNACGGANGVISDTQFR